MKLLGDVCAEIGGGAWEYPLQDEGRRCFVGFLRSPFPPEQCRELFDLVKSGTAWQQPDGPQGPMPRKTAWMVSGDCCCTYRYGSVEVSPQPYPPWMAEVMKVAMPQFGMLKPNDWPNGCNINLYEDGGMSVGWHSDDEKLFQGKFQDVRILSLSLGAKRKFELRANWPEDGEQTPTTLQLGDGDLCTMEGMVQKHYQHRVPKEGNIQGPRINLTWRWVVVHGARCPVARDRPK